MTLNRFHLKMLACLTMLIDHIGYIFFPRLLVLRLIGRLAFPLFAFMLAEGYAHTQKRSSYALRLLLFAVLSQLPFTFAFSFPSLFSPLNIGFTLLFGFAAIYAYDTIDSRPVSLTLILALSIAAELLDTDYGAYGVAVIFLFYLFKDRFWQLLTAQLALNIINTIIIYVRPLSPGTGYLSPQILCLSALTLIYFYNGKKGLDAKGFFYGFYPGHLILLGLLAYLL